MNETPTTVHLEIRVDKFDGRTLTDEGTYPVDSRIGRLFYGQGRAERVVIHEATGDTRTYTYLGDNRSGAPMSDAEISATAAVQAVNAATSNRP